MQVLSVQLKNRRLEVVELVALFLHKTETCDAKNSCESFVDAIFCLAKIGFYSLEGMYDVNYFMFRIKKRLTLTKAFANSFN